MRLLYLTDRLSDRGGADHHLAQVISASIAAGHRVTVAYGRDEGGMAIPDSVELRRVRGLASRIDSPSRLGGLAPLLGSADLVHIQNLMNPSALGLAVEGGRTVVTVQDHRVFCPGLGKTLTDGSACKQTMDDQVCGDCIPDKAYRQSILELTRRRLAALLGSHVVVLSSYMAEELAAVGVEGVRIVPPWVEVGPKRSEPGTTFVLGGRLVAHKGIKDGWRAWHGADRPMPLVIAGSGPLENDLGGAQCLGWLKPEELRVELRRARALIFPARWQEPFGILGLEALAQGTPVVVAESGGTNEWSASGCIRVPAGDVPAMTAAIGRLAAEPQYAMELGRQGQSAVVDRFSRERILPKLSQLYRRVASS